MRKLGHIIFAVCLGALTVLFIYDYYRLPTVLRPTSSSLFGGSDVTGVSQDTLKSEPLKNLSGKSTTRVLQSKIILTATNLQRLNNGVKSLQWNDTLKNSAESKAQDILNKQYFEHISPEGVGPAQLAAQVGYKYVVIGENLALGNFETESALVDAWMNSPGHRENILNPKFTEIGIAAKRGTYEGKTVWVAVQEFGTPLSSCPQVSSALKDQIDTNKSQLQIMETDLKVKEAAINEPGISNQEKRDRIEDYNNLVNVYNNLIDRTKNLVNQYNAEVGQLNQCIQDNS